MQTLTTSPQTTKTVRQLLYSKSAIARVLNVALEEIEKYQFWKTGVWVKVIGKRPTIIAFKTLKQHFVDFRKSKIHDLVAYQNSQNQWEVYNSQSQSCYQVQVHSGKITCTCDDYLTQQQLLPKACCKHCYKVLNQIGFNSLIDYLTQQKVA